MPSIFSRLKGKDGPTKVKSKKNGAGQESASQVPAKPRWEDAYTRKTVEPEEIHELVRLCVDELKARALDIPFLLLPFRPTSDPSAVRTFIRHFFDQQAPLSGELLLQELRMTEPMVISGVVKWCWSRLQGGIVGWDAYELFKIGEQDSHGAHSSFTTFIPLSVDNHARSSIIFSFFDLMSAIAAHGKVNGFGGRKLSRMASWWAFENNDTGNGFEGGYKEWLKAADATSHLFFAYLRSLSPQQGVGSFAILPMSLQKLLQETEYPPQRPSLLQSSTNKVIMIVDTVSPTPFALLRRGNHFQYREEDRALREFSNYDDPVQALTDECRRVLKAVSAANQTQAVSSSKHSTSLRDASWSRFEDIGFGSVLEEEDDEDESAKDLVSRRNRGLRTTPASGGDGLARPTTPSWADFLSSGFVDDGPNSPTNMLLPPDKVLPPIDAQIRQKSSQSHRPRLETERTLEPGELASISRFDLDDSFWWVWMTSLAPEETPERKSTFGRCAVIETRIRSGRWLVMEEIVKGAAAEPDPGAYIAEKKGFFSWTRRNKGISRSKSTGKQALDRGQNGLLAPGNTLGVSKTSVAPDQQAKIQAAAQRLHERQRREEREQAGSALTKRGRVENSSTEKTTSVLTIQPVIASEASSAMKWASKYDKEAIRDAYLSNANAGRGTPASMSTPAVHLNGIQSSTNGHEKSNAATEGTRKPLASPAAASQPTAAPAPEQAPVVAAASPKPSASLTILPAPARNEDSLDLSEKAVRVADSPTSIHPAERQEESGRTSPPVPPKDNQDSLDATRPAVVPPAPAVQSSPESKKTGKKLHKDGKEEKTSLPPSSGGLRKLFGRKNRQSKLPDNAAAGVNALLAADANKGAAPKAAPAPAAPVQKPASIASTALPAAAPAAAPAAPAAPEAAVTPAVAAAPAVSPAPVTAPAPPVQNEQPVDPPRTPTVPEPVYAPSNDSLSRVGTAEAQDAAKEFSRFDQGPLTDQPAFVPDDSDNDADEAVPPPIARQRSPVSPEPVTPVPTKEASPPPAVPAIDRWAQIRKNAADRAAQRQVEEVPRKEYTSKPSDADGDTSGEETIESRVARIKARVAELTGNMEGVSPPGARAPPPIRR
ncbi:morphogenesis protein (Msb1) [Sporothrix schenckii 1099-18]|uniref:Morphogenesis protein (Msb1) n=1 Tax=Sporothrix schenckii 1099-18 TaxID=1397361 RepID=A0A0F2LT29_SPOSC|nr:morphogenesis protein (Msb1) [Sporothrix schenckii 1099-18]KJR80648.1 morphogenesis protein (Msb1) [Sporothrix schenckii 1099-18]